MIDYTPTERPYNERPVPQYGPYLPSTAPQTDMLRRDNLPPIEGMELNYRESPSEETDVFFYVTRIPALLFGILLFNSVIVGPVAMLLGPFIASDLLLPLWIAISVCLGCSATKLNGDGHVTAARFLLPLLAPIVVVNTYWVARRDPAGIVTFVVVLAVVGFLADSIATHYCYFMTANPRLAREAVCRRRNWWNARFNPLMATAIVRTLKEDMAAARLTDDTSRLRAMEEQLEEYPSIVQYSLGFLILPIYLILGMFSRYRVVLLGPLVLSLLWAYRNPRVMPRLDVFLHKVVLRGLHCWLSWGRWQSPFGPSAPGLFISPRGSWSERMTMSGVALWGAASIFAAPMMSWGRGIPLSREWTITLALDVLTVALLPAIVLVSVFVAVAGAALGGFYQAIETEESPETEERRSWTLRQCYSRRLAESKHPLESEHIYLGANRDTGDPVLVHLPLINRHAHVMGPTGSGKTALGLAPLVHDLIVRGDGGMTLIDMKGDPAFFEEVRSTCEEQGREFKWFHSEHDHSSYAFTAVEELNRESVSIAQVVQELMEGLSLDYGRGYGKSFFTSQNHEALLATLKHFPDSRSFRELFEKTGPEYFERLADRDRVKELIATLEKLAEIPQLNWIERGDQQSPIAVNAIRMTDVVNENLVAFFCIPAIGETVTVKDIAAVVSLDLCACAKTYCQQNGKPKQTYLIVDEFQQMASQPFLLALRMGRSFGLSFIVANQTLSDLRVKDTPDLLNATWNNTSMRQFFSPSDPEIEEILLHQSGETIHTDLFYSEFRREELEPALRTLTKPYFTVKTGDRRNLNDLKSYSSEPGTCIVQFPRDSGYTCYGGHWFAVRSDFHIDQETYEKRLNAKWPVGNESTIVAHRKMAPQLPELRTRLLGNAARTDTACEGHLLDTTSPLLLPSTDVQRWHDRLEAIYTKRFSHV